MSACLRRGLCAVLTVFALLVPIVGARPASSAAAPAKPTSPPPPPPPPQVVGMAATPSGHGYWLTRSDGSIAAYGDEQEYGSTAGITLDNPIVGIARNTGGPGYWLVASDGGIFGFGEAAFYGGTGGTHLNRPIVGMAASPSGRGYSFVASDGGVFAFGDAGFHGSTGDLELNEPIVGMAATPSGEGYWLVARDGGIFAFGDATFYGSTGDTTLTQPIVGMAATPTGHGYWLVARDGGIFAFGDATFYGSAGDTTLAKPIVGMDASPTGHGYWLVASDGGIFTYGDAPFEGSLPADAAAMPLTVETIADGLTIPWDIAFTPDGTMLYTERPGRITARFPDGSSVLVADLSATLETSGENGLLGLAVDPSFSSNRTVYTCQTNASPREVRIVKWSVADDYSGAVRTADPLFGGIPSTSTTHIGCRLRFGPDGYLYASTGDSTIGTAPQDLDNLAGKVLRIDASTGQPAPGNPFGTAVYTYGHRNPQGLAFRPGTGQLFETEHGPNVDDEVNILRPGGNAGWNPDPGNVDSYGGVDTEDYPGYNQNVPMTDLNAYPDAIVPVWASGFPTLATSGSTFLTGDQWGRWNGALVVACLKASKLVVMTLDQAGNVIDQDFALDHQYGRLRTPVEGPDGALYVTTSNGDGADRILRIRLG